MERLAVNIHGSIYNKLKSYREYYEEYLGGKLELNYVVEEMLKTVMEEDKDYKAYLKALEEKQTPAPAAKSASRSTENAATQFAAAPSSGDSREHSELN
jgi:hypothetical protein